MRISPDKDVLWMCVTVPVTGRVNALCNDIDEPCEASHSACVGGICVCVDGFLPTHDFSCCKCSHDTDPCTAPTLADTKGFVASNYLGLIVTKGQGFMPISYQGCIPMNYRVNRTPTFILPPTKGLCLSTITNLYNVKGLYLPTIKVYTCQLSRFTPAVYQCFLC